MLEIQKGRIYNNKTKRHCKSCCSGKIPSIQTKRSHQIFFEKSQLISKMTPPSIQIPLLLIKSTCAKVVFLLNLKNVIILVAFVPFIIIIKRVPIISIKDSHCRCSRQKYENMVPFGQRSYFKIFPMLILYPTNRVIHKRTNSSNLQISESRKGQNSLTSVFFMPLCQPKKQNQRLFSYV